MSTRIQLDRKHKNYYKNLFYQFVSARGIKVNAEKIFEDILAGKDDVRGIARDFQYWLDEMKSASKTSKDIIGKYAFHMAPGYKNGAMRRSIPTDLFEDRRVIEVGKGLADSLVRDTNNPVITPLAKDFKSNMLRSRFEGTLGSYRGKPIIIYTNGRMEFLDDSMYDVFMTSNIRGLNDIHEWAYVYESGNANILLAAFGNFYDKDKDRKDNLIYKFAKKYNCKNYIIGAESLNDPDTYCSFAFTGHIKSETGMPKHRVRSINGGK